MQNTADKKETPKGDPYLNEDYYPDQRKRLMDLFEKLAHEGMLQFNLKDFVRSHKSLFEVIISAMRNRDDAWKEERKQRIDLQERNEKFYDELYKKETKVIDSTCDISTDTAEGKLLMAALAMITTESRQNNTPDEVVKYLMYLAAYMHDNSRDPLIKRALNDAVDANRLKNPAHDEIKELKFRLDTQLEKVKALSDELSRYQNQKADVNQLQMSETDKKYHDELRDNPNKSSGVRVIRAHNFEHGLRQLINIFSMENQAGDTPDFILQEYLSRQIKLAEWLNKQRDQCQGRGLSMGGGAIHQDQELYPVTDAELLDAAADLLILGKGYCTREKAKDDIHIHALSKKQSKYYQNTQNGLSTGGLQNPGADQSSDRNRPDNMPGHICPSPGLSPSEL